MQAYLARYGHGSATVLGEKIHRTSAWIGMFVNEARHASVDEAVSLLRVLNADPAKVLLKPRENGEQELLGPADPREGQLLKNFYKLSERERRAVLDLQRSFLRSRSVTDAEDRPGIRRDDVDDATS